MASPGLAPSHAGSGGTWPGRGWPAISAGPPADLDWIGEPPWGRKTEHDEGALSCARTATHGHERRNNDHGGSTRADDHHPDPDLARRPDRPPAPYPRLRR